MTITDPAAPRVTAARSPVSASASRALARSTYSEQQLQLVLVAEQKVDVTVK